MQRSAVVLAVVLAAALLAGSTTSVLAEGTFLFRTDFEDWPVGPVGANTCTSRGWTCGPPPAVVAFGASGKELLVAGAGDGLFDAQVPPGTLVSAEVEHALFTTLSSESFLLRLRDGQGRLAELRLGPGAVLRFHGCDRVVDAGWVPHANQWFTYRLVAGPPAVLEIAQGVVRERFDLPCLGLSAVHSVAFGHARTPNLGAQGWDDLTLLLHS